MAMPDVNMRQLLEAGVHFGHSTHRWNPKMRPFIFGVRNNIHIIDLQQTVPLLDQALQTLRDTVANGGRVLFVGTKRQAQDKVQEAAAKSGQYFVNSRWLGGMLTNWQTISHSISRLRELEEFLAQEDNGLTKKENLMLSRERQKLETAIGGIKDMGGLPDILFIIDTNKEDLAVHEATKLGIPVIGVTDTNSDPELVDYPIPGNDDAIRSINHYLDMATASILEGIQREVASSGKDAGEAENVTVDLPKEDSESAEKKAEPASAQTQATTDAPEQATVEENSADKSGEDVEKKASNA